MDARTINASCRRIDRIRDAVRVIEKTLSDIGSNAPECVSSDVLQCQTAFLGWSMGAWEDLQDKLNSLKT